MCESGILNLEFCNNPPMPRLFDIRDIGVVQRLQAHARPLATHLVVVGGISPLPQAMRSYVGGVLDNTICLVEQTDPDGIAFGLMQLLPDESTTDVARQRGAALILMSPAPNTEGMAAAWVNLVHAFGEQAGERGAHHLIADVPDGSLEASVLQAAGFVPMIQQDLVKLAKPLEPAGNIPKDVPGVRQATADDAPQIRALHIRTASRMTYAAERSADALFDSLRVTSGFVLEQHNEIMGYVGFWHGRRGRAMRCLFRPEAFSAAQDTIAFALHKSNYRRATYCNIRHYQNWLLPAMTALGFVQLGSTMLMTKYTSARVHAPVWSAILPQLARARKIVSSRLDHTTRVTKK
jgi:hypothetical protein